MRRSWFKVLDWIVIGIAIPAVLALFVAWVLVYALASLSRVLEQWGEVE